MITNAVMDLYDRIVDEHLLVRRITITANKLVDEKNPSSRKMNTSNSTSLPITKHRGGRSRRRKKKKLERERRMQEAMLSIKKKFGKMLC